MLSCSLSAAASGKEKQTYQAAMMKQPVIKLHRIEKEQPALLGKLLLKRNSQSLQLLLLLYY